MWQRAKTGGRASLDRFWGWTSPLLPPESPKKLDTQAYWPTTLDKECDKAARILRSFSKDGFQAGHGAISLDEPKRTNSAVRRLPEEVLRRAKGLVIFTIMRSGLWVSGAGGSGILVARLPDGTWSPPSAILLHTDGVAALVEDLYDCVLVLNTFDALHALSQERYTIGYGISLVSGPIGSGDFPDSDIFGIPAPIYTYLKAHGLSADVQLSGAVIVERADENERFYRRKVTSSDILNGRVTKVPTETGRLIQTIKASQGDTDVDPSMLTLEAAPSDMDLADGRVFGVPNKDDPDPFGFLALQKEGLVVREAGSQKRASVESFHFIPSPNSPLFNAFNRASGAGNGSPRSSWRTSVTERSMTTMDIATQTDTNLTVSVSRPESLRFRTSMTSISEADLPSIEQKIEQVRSADSPDPNASVETLEADTQFPTNQSIILHTKDLDKNNRHLEQLPVTPLTDAVGISPFQETIEETMNPHKTKDEESAISTANNQHNTLVEETIQTTQTEDSDADDEDAEEDEDIVIHKVIQTAAPRIITASPQVITKARLVTVNKLPPPPALPARNPIRSILPRSPSPTASFQSSNTRLSVTGTESTPRPNSSAGSSTYSLKRDGIPISAGATDSLGSVSSVDEGERSRNTSIKELIDNEIQNNVNDSTISNSVTAVEPKFNHVNTESEQR